MCSKYTINPIMNPHNFPYIKYFGNTTVTFGLKSIDIENIVI